MHIGVQGRLVCPQPVDYGVVRGLCAALCGRYACLRYVAVGHSGRGQEIPALVLSAAPAAQRVLLVSALSRADWWTALCALRLCEEMCAHLRADLSLCRVPLRRALMERQVWFVPLPHPDGGDVTYHSTAGRGEMQALGQKSENFCPETAADTVLTDLCRHISFRHAVVLGGGTQGIGWYGGDATPPHSGLMAQVLSAVSGFAAAQPLDGAGFAAWFLHTFRRPALALRLGEEPPVFDRFYATIREMLLLSTLF